MDPWLRQKWYEHRQARLLYEDSITFRMFAAWIDEQATLQLEMQNALANAISSTETPLKSSVATTQNTDAGRHNALDVQLLQHMNSCLAKCFALVDDAFEYSLSENG